MEFTNVDEKNPLLGLQPALEMTPGGPKLDMEFTESLTEAQQRIKDLELEVTRLAENEQSALNEAAVLRALLLKQRSESQAKPLVDGRGRVVARRLTYNSKTDPSQSPLPTTMACTQVHILRESMEQSLGFEIGRFFPGQGYQVERVKEGSPAEIAGLQVGDMIIAIDECDVRNVDEDTAHECLRRASTLMTVKVADVAAQQSYDQSGSLLPEGKLERKRSFYEKMGGKIHPKMEVNPDEVDAPMKIKANVMGMSAKAPDLWTFFLGWRRWRKKMLKKQQYSARYMTGPGGPAMPTSTPKIDPNSEFSVLTDSMSNEHNIYESESNIGSDSESVILGFDTSAKNKTHRKKHEQNPRSDADYVKLESLIKTRKKRVDMSKLDLSQDSSASSALRIVDTEEMQRNGDTEKLMMTNGSYSSNNEDAASVYNSDVYLQDANDTTVAWEQFQNLFSDGGQKTPLSTATPSQSNDSDAKNTPNGFLSIPLTDTPYHDDGRGSPTPSETWTSISRVSAHTFVIDGPTDPAQAGENAAERAWRNNYMAHDNSNAMMGSSTQRQWEPELELDYHDAPEWTAPGTEKSAEPVEASKQKVAEPALLSATEPLPLQSSSTQASVLDPASDSVSAVKEGSTEDGTTTPPETAAPNATSTPLQNSTLLRSTKKDPGLRNSSQNLNFDTASMVSVASSRQSYVSTLSHRPRPKVVQSDVDEEDTASSVSLSLSRSDVAGLGRPRSHRSRSRSAKPVLVADGIFAKSLADHQSSAKTTGNYRSPTASLSKRPSQRKRIDLSKGTKGLFEKSLATVRSNSPAPTPGSNE